VWSQFNLWSGWWFKDRGDLWPLDRLEVFSLYAKLAMLHTHRHRHTHTQTHTHTHKHTHTLCIIIKTLLVLLTQNSVCLRSAFRSRAFILKGKKGSSGLALSVRSLHFNSFKTNWNFLDYVNIIMYKSRLTRTFPPKSGPVGVNRKGRGLGESDVTHTLILSSGPSAVWRGRALRPFLQPPRRPSFIEGQIWLAAPPSGGGPRVTLIPDQSWRLRCWRVPGVLPSSPARSSSPGWGTDLRSGQQSGTSWSPDVWSRYRLPGGLRGTGP